ncbi:uncharacterized protein LY79DRAFT_272669 [Colletotrichum navitas]|uniref:Uncharacterized protein n=1 Tax=Colletotrichum navitas TaxID=681940 RepID=A0AAD8PVC0_9PEZI|nr:uncharacterized protein LY79DRAFT_272669 [Colletotrichum navitas]KAK1585377.1 hypothetical protein LY79DRAFT_272669 [Colletotrichum navitas]
MEVAPWLETACAAIKTRQEEGRKINGSAASRQIRIVLVLVQGGTCRPLCHVTGTRMDCRAEFTLEIVGYSCTGRERESHFTSSMTFLAFHFFPGSPGTRRQVRTLSDSDLVETPVLIGPYELLQCSAAQHPPLPVHPSIHIQWWVAVLRSCCAARCTLSGEVLVCSSGWVVPSSAKIGGPASPNVALVVIPFRTSLSFFLSLSLCPPLPSNPPKILRRTPCFGRALASAPRRLIT